MAVCPAIAQTAHLKHRKALTQILIPVPEARANNRAENSEAARRADEVNYKDRIQKIEQDVDAFTYRLLTESGHELEVLTTQRLEGNTLILDNLHLGGPGPGSSNTGELSPAR